MCLPTCSPISFLDILSSHLLLEIFPSHPIHHGDNTYPRWGKSDAPMGLTCGFKEVDTTGCPVHHRRGRSAGPQLCSLCPGPPSVSKPSSGSAIENTHQQSPPVLSAVWSPVAGKWELQLIDSGESREVRREKERGRVRSKRREEENQHNFCFFFYSESKLCQVSTKNVSSALLVKLYWQSFKTCKRIIKAKQLQCTAYQIIGHVAYFAKRRLLPLVMSFFSQTSINTIILFT